MIGGRRREREEEGEGERERECVKHNIIYYGV